MPRNFSPNSNCSLHRMVAIRSATIPPTFNARSVTILQPPIPRLYTIPMLHNLQQMPREFSHISFILALIHTDAYSVDPK